jgi:hypothetical protein
MRSLTERLGGNAHKTVVVDYSEDVFTTISRVDTAKLTIAAEDGSACFVDIDCFVSKPLHELDISKPGPWMAKYEYNFAMECPDICYFYVNNCREWFAKNLPVSIITPKQYSVKPDVLKNLDGFNTIPEMSYFHFYNSMSSVDGAVTARALRKHLSVLKSGIDSLQKTFEMVG